MIADEAERSPVLGGTGSRSGFSGAGLWPGFMSLQTSHRGTRPCLAGCPSQILSLPLRPSRSIKDARFHPTSSFSPPHPSNLPSPPLHPSQHYAKCHPTIIKCLAAARSLSASSKVSSTSLRFVGGTVPVIFIPSPEPPPFSSQCD